MKTRNTYSFILEFLGFILAFWAVARLGIHVYQYLRFPLPLDDGEGHVLNMALMISKGSLPYPPIDTPPYVVTNYPPLFPALTSIPLHSLKEMTLIPGTTVFPGLIITRLISVLSGLGICILIYATSIKLKVHRESATISAFLFLAMPIVYFWFDIGKPDMLALFLGLWGLYLGISNLENGSKIYISLIPLLLAIFTRQSEIAPFLAILFYLILHRDRRWLGFLLIYSISIIIVVTVLQLSTGGEFLRHIITYTKTKFYPDRLQATWSFFASYFLIPLTVSIVACIQSFSKRTFTPAHLYFVFAILISLTAGKVGSDLNYFIESIIAGHLLLALVISDSFLVNSTNRWRLASAGLIFLIALDYSFIHDNRILSFTPSKKDYINGSALVQIIKKQSGPILSEDEAFAAITGKDVIINPFIMTELAKEGIWDQGDFVRMIEDEKFDLVILRFDINSPNNPDKPASGGYAGWDRWTDEMEKAISENYVSFATISLRRPWFLYYPKRAGIKRTES